MGLSENLGLHIATWQTSSHDVETKMAMDLYYYRVTGQINLEN